MTALKCFTSEYDSLFLDLTLIFLLGWSLCPDEMHTWDAQRCTMLPEILREQFISLAIQMNTIKESLGDFPFGLGTHHLPYHAVYETFTGKQLAA